MKIGFAQAVKNHGDAWRLNGLQDVFRVFGVVDHPVVKAYLFSNGTVTPDFRDYLVMRDWMPGGFMRTHFRRG